MIRSLVVVGAIALALLPPAVTLGAPTMVVRGGPVAAPPPRSAGGHFASPESFRVPFHVDLRPKPTEPNAQTTFSPYRWHAWQWAPQYFANQPLWYQNGCFANSLFGVPSALPNDASMPAGVTIGSLVDDRSKHLFSSTPSYKGNLPLSGTGVVTLQPTSCGSASFINF